jgi:hypothetical protein
MNSPPHPTNSVSTDCITRRQIVTASAALLISSCAIPPVIVNAIDTAIILGAGAPDTLISTEYVNNLPYASMAAKIGRKQRSLLILGRYDGPDLHWISADNAAVVTRNGRLVKTAGIGMDLLDTRGIETDPVAAATFAFDGVQTRTVDLQETARMYGVPITSRFEVIGRETIKILGRPQDTLAVRETNVAGTIRWSFENRYWFDFKSGFLWKSTQHFARNVAPLEMEVLKPAR